MTTGDTTPAADHKYGSFEGKVFPAELSAIRARHNAMRRAQIGKDPSAPTTALDLAGLACSGGGIRSASFCLGVLQGLQSKGVIDRMDYLSTVSGGGYIGTTLTIGLSRSKAFPFGRVGGENRETPEVRHLRDHSRYLVHNGLASIISAAVIYLRGLMTGALVILPILLVCATLLILLNPNTSELTRTTVLSFNLSDFFSGSRIPLTRLLLLVLGALLVFYALAVSILPIASPAARSRSAKVASIVLAVCAAAALIEIHTMLLRVVFEMDHRLPSPDSSDSVNAAQIFKNLYEAAQSFALYVAPFVIAVLPFLKQLITSATAGEMSSWGGLAKKLASRLLLLLAAAVIPVLLWLTMMQLAYWGTIISECVTNEAKHCLSLAENPKNIGWPHAPVFLQWLFGQPVCWKAPAYLQWLGPIFCWRAPAIYVGIALACVGLWFVLSANANSLHQLYRDRLARAFLIKRSNETLNPTTELDDSFRLRDIDPTAGPYHLINAALNVPGSAFANRRGRNADFFIFSRRFIGSEATGYVRTETAEEEVDGLNIGTAMAISGAAAAPNMGMASIRLLSPTIAFLNVRLGRWIRHPHDIASKDAKRAIRKSKDDSYFKRVWINLRSIPRAHHLLFEAFAKSGIALHEQQGRNLKNNGFVYLTDGGHIDNLGIYELLRRRCRLIIAIDAEADPDLDAGSLVQVERFARIDLNVTIRMNWKPIAERTRAVSAGGRSGAATKGPHVAVGRIEYPPPSPGGKIEEGVLVYIKASLTGDENDYVTAYKRAYPRFPHETTADQLFSEEQFEVYRALGEHIARRFVDDTDDVAMYDNDRAALLADLKVFLP